MKTKITQLAIITALLLTSLSSSLADIDHLAAPAAYDNAGGTAYEYGQTFIAVDSSFYGVQVYIGDPSRPTNSAVNELLGPVWLALYDVSNLSQAVGVAPVLPAGVTVNGLTSLHLPAPIATTIGTRYFFTLRAADPFGFGLRSLTTSTYAGGGESVLDLNTRALSEGERDLSFAVLSKPLGGLFTDDFDRPDSDTVGNGWLDMVGNAGPGLQIRSNRLTTTNAIVGNVGVCRPFLFSEATALSASLTHMNGFSCDPLRYACSFAILNDGAIDHGFGVRLVRSGSLYQNSQVILFEGTNALAVTDCTFQFGESISLSCTIFADGRVRGIVAGSGQEFLFEFGTRSIASVGTNFAFWTEYPATQSDCIIPPTLDNLTVSAEPAAVQASIRVSEVEVCWSSQVDVLYQVDYRSDLTTSLWAPLFTNIPGTGGTICVHDTVLPGASQRFYRVVAPTR